MIVTYPYESLVPLWIPTVIIGGVFLAVILIAVITDKRK